MDYPEFDFGDTSSPNENLVLTLERQQFLNETTPVNPNFRYSIIVN
jgi:hypothetical protein